MEKFLDRVKNKGAYIALMEDLIGKEFIPNKTHIMQNRIMGKSNSLSVNEKLINSCKNIGKALGGNNMSVGEIHGYVEPCPIAYTGCLKEGDKFKTVFLGLNPHLEPPRMFNTQNKDADTTFADLGNFHHPDDMYNGYRAERYAPEGAIGNAYWRVFGHMESGAAWSQYYTKIIRIHMALMLAQNGKEYDMYFTWPTLKSQGKEYAKNEAYLKHYQKGMKKNELALCNYLLQELKNNPMANIEMIPYKSVKYNANNFSSIFRKFKDEKYRSYYEAYLTHIFEFIDEYSASDAFIIIPTNLSNEKVTQHEEKGTIQDKQKEKEEKFSLTEVYKVVEEQIKKLHGNLTGGYFVYKKPNGEEKNTSFESAIPPKKEKSKLTPLYLAKWTSIDDDKKNRKVIIAPSVSGHSSDYSWIYTDFSYGWIDAIIEHFSDKQN